MNKRIYTALLAMIILICSGCTGSIIINYDEMATEEIFIHATKCNAEQAEYIAYILEQCGAGKMQDIRQGRHERYWILTYPEGTLELQLDKEKNLFSISNEYVFQRGFLLYVCAGHIINGAYIEEDTILGTLISSHTERQYYLDTTLSMIKSIEDMLIVEEVEILSPYGLEVSEPEFSDPVFLDYEGESFVCRKSDDIVYVGYNIYSDYSESNSNSNNRGVKFSFIAEFAMLHPVSIRLEVSGSDGEMIESVWNGEYYEAFGESFDEFRAEVIDGTPSFTEDDINQALQTLSEFFAP